eukprot:NODE_590_length_6345_cov_0.379283.p1 type:complete len:280 gc:universal NODE_590_length_6345_cov_0.379283:1716-2555(+)
MQFVPIRPEREIGELPTSLFMIAITTISHIQSILDTISPLKVHLKHLKGIQMLKNNPSCFDIPVVSHDMVAILLCPKSKSVEAKLLLANCTINYFRFIRLPTLSPMSLVQYEKWRYVWPIQFKDNKDKNYKVEDSTKLQVGIKIKEMVESKHMASIFNDDSSILLCSRVLDHIFYSDNPDSAIFNHSIFSLLSALAQDEQTADVQDDDRYLATKLDCILLFEPCLMCGMALLHSRIKRIFICAMHPNCGHEKAFTDFNLHCQPELNHRFLVYNVLTELE